MDTPASLFNYTSEEVGNMTPDDVLKATRQVRFETIRIATSQGIPVENADVMNIVESNLKGLENQAINLKKITVDEKANKNLEAIGQAVVANIILSRPDTGRRLETPMEQATLPALPNDIGEAQFVPGEADPVSLTPETVDSFMERMNQP